MEVCLTRSRRLRRVPLASDFFREVRQRVGRLVPYAIGSPGSFAERVRKLTGIEGFHVHQMRHTFRMSVSGAGRIVGRATASAWAREHRDDAAVRKVVG